MRYYGTLSLFGKMQEINESQNHPIQLVLEEHPFIIFRSLSGWWFSPILGSSFPHFSRSQNMCNKSNSSTIMLKCLQTCVSSKQILVVDSTIQKEPSLANSFGPFACPDWFHIGLQINSSHLMTKRPRKFRNLLVSFPTDNVSSYPKAQVPNWRAADEVRTLPHKCYFSWNLESNLLEIMTSSTAFSKFSSTDILILSPKVSAT